MSLYRHLHSSFGSVQKIALAASTFVMTIALPVIAKADVISTPRIGRSSSFLVMAAISILVAVIGLIMIIRRRR
ncbi:hypothetical protein HMPREF1647_05075 [Lancefieldella parvula DNF00906]|uniref:hypothetical protein n=1 Tax=Lancefieldella parvula TaxID=1382 RepID=UPI00050E4C9B|nr:hypothetical protein [Lancefieldella parvula]KGF13403.1 hypothetical protein HMPREF1647_05075 [Lancefieldella parvula DNF00906]